MRQQIRHAKYGIVWILAQRDGHHRTVLLRHHAVQRQRQRDPLVILDAAVIMRVKQREAVGFVQGILLQVKARGIDVRTQNIQTLGQRLRAQLDQHERFAMRMRPHFVTRLQGATIADCLLERNIPSVLSCGNSSSSAFALGLILGDELDILGSKAFELLHILLGVFLPSNFSFHVKILSNVPLMPTAKRGIMTKGSELPRCSQQKASNAARWRAGGFRGRGQSSPAEQARNIRPAKSLPYCASSATSASICS